ncbi:DEAD/DEAH box helicase [Candidatus Pacearchaeota archaeon]|nr:DEAD/DEAH box helicase [Candidatus Pacearchaeota archaeon]
MKLILTENTFYAIGDPEIAKAAGFSPVKLSYKGTDKWAWATKSSYIALNLIDFATGDALHRLILLEEEIDSSELRWFSDPVPAPDGQIYFPFQPPAIQYAARHKICMIADDMGLGKTIESLGVANLLGLKHILVICPAALRDNWAREMNIWHMNGNPVSIIRTGKTIFGNACSLIISYQLAVKRFNELMEIGFDLIILDEAHRLKNPEAKQTQKILGHELNEGIVSRSDRVLMLTGTPYPNWPDELAWILNKMKPSIIDNMSPGSFIQRFCTFENGDYGVVITGSKNETELYNRLRSGFMVRRLKEDVLSDLPEISFKMIVFPQDQTIRKIIEKEKNFDAEEIYRNGVPLGSPFPEIRRELGEAKVPLTVQYVEDLFADGAKKVVVVGHHVDAMGMIFEELMNFKPALVLGKVKNKQAEVDMFQNDPECRVMILNDAGFEGYTMTAGAEMVFHESSFVPGHNAQAIGRVFRIGQTCKVIVHILLIEASIEAYILGRAAEKQRGFDMITDGKL